MDAKYLAEIKARADRDISNLERMEHVGYISQNYAHQGAAITMRTLLAKVERLMEENQGLRANSMIQEHIISGGSDPIKDDKIVRLIMNSAAKDQQIATLKKALELMYADNKGYNPDGMGNPTWYIHQAQEQEGHDGN